MQFSQSPFALSASEQHGVETFAELLRQNSEICNECYAQVRDIGPEYSKLLERSGDCRLDLPDLDLRTNEWYERTTEGSQEHSPFDRNRRFGTCFCLQCGGDLSDRDGDHSLAGLLERVDRIVTYVTEETGASVEGDRYHREVKALKTTDEYQGWDTEILALGFARALQSDVVDGGGAAAEAT